MTSQRVIISMRLLLIACLLLGYSALTAQADPGKTQTINNITYVFTSCATLTCTNSASTGTACWLFPSSSTITIAMSVQNPTVGGYVGIGFSAGGNGGAWMVGSSAVIGWLGGAAGPFIDNFDLKGQNTGNNLPGSTVLQLASNKSVTSAADGSTVILFTRPLSLTNTAYSSFANIPDPTSNGISNNIIFSFGGVPSDVNSVLYHGFGNHGQGTINFATGSYAAVGSDIQAYRNAHASLMTIAFGFFFPIGIMFARFFKNYGPSWLHLHRFFVMIGWVLVLAGFIIAEKKISTGENTTHRGIGIYVFAAIMFQPLNAIVRPHPPAKGEQPSTMRRVWNALHHYNARIAYVLAIVNIYIGFTILAPGTGDVILFSVLWSFVMFLGVLLQLYVIYFGELGADRVAKADPLGPAVNVRSSVDTNGQPATSVSDVPVSV